jgi:hypothetical protein
LCRTGVSRQDQGRGRPDARRAVELDAAAVELGEQPGKRQAEACAVEATAQFVSLSIRMMPSTAVSNNACRRMP